MTSQLREASTREGIAALVVVDAVLVVERSTEYMPLALAPVVKSGLVLGTGWVKESYLRKRGVWSRVDKVGLKVGLVSVIFSLSLLIVGSFHYSNNGVFT
jgi:hypothetical protein